MVLLVIGDRGTVVIQRPDRQPGQRLHLPSWRRWILVAGGDRRATRSCWPPAGCAGRAPACPSEPPLLSLARLGLLAVALAFGVWVVNQDRGVPYVVLMLAGLFLLWSYMLNRSRFGRHIYAIGGNIEAARRAGITG